MSDNNSSNNHSHSRNSSHSISRHHSRSSNHSKRSYTNSSYLSDSSSRSYSCRSRSRSRDYSPSSRSRHSYRENVGLPKIFITKLSPQVTEKDIEKEFKVFGEIKNINLKRGYAFVEYYSKGDAKDAIRKLDNQKLFGQNQRVVVEEAIGRRRDRERDRDRDRDHDRRRDRYYHDRYRYRDREKYRNDDYSSRHKSRKTGPKESDVCFNCGKLGHWANECHLPKSNK